MSQRAWLVTDLVPGIERQPLKKLAVDATQLLRFDRAVAERGDASGLPIIDTLAL